MFSKHAIAKAYHFGREKPSNLKTIPYFGKLLNPNKKNLDTKNAFKTNDKSKKSDFYKWNCGSFPKVYVGRTIRNFSVLYSGQRYIYVSRTLRNFSVLCSGHEDLKNEKWIGHMPTVCYNKIIV